MKKRRVWLWLVSGFVFGAVILAALLEPNRILRGLLAGEPFYRGRPASYWRQVLRDCGQNGGIPLTTAKEFHTTKEILPVLRVCAGDPDRNVRWPAIALLGQRDYPTQPAQEVLVEALEDEDNEVRLQAIRGLAKWGRMSRPAIPALTAHLHDSELQVAHAADLALWEIDTSSAVAACGWHLFTSPEFEFSVMLPEQPEREDKHLFEGLTFAHVFQAWHRAGPYQAPTRYVVQVSEYPEEVLKGATEEELFRRWKDSVPDFFPGGKIVEEKEILLGELCGREYLLEVEGQGCLRSRQFWVGQKLYSLMVAHQPEFVNARAMTYFLNSFQLKERADIDMPARPDPDNAHSAPLAEVTSNPAEPDREGTVYE
jgi:hypothetical protein